MKKYFKSIYKNIIGAFKLEFALVFASNMALFLFQFFTNLVLIRILKKDEFGSFSYVFNILGLFLLSSGVGIVPGILQYCGLNRNLNERKEYFKFGLRIGLIFNLFISLIIFIIGKLGLLSLSVANELLLVSAFLPFISLIYQATVTYFRASLSNKKYSLLLFSYGLTIFVCTYLGAVIKGVLGIIISRYVTFVLLSILGISMMGSLKEDEKINIDKRKFVNYSFFSMINNAIYQLFLVIDLFLIGQIMVDPIRVANFKTASLIPFSLLVIPGTLMNFLYPFFVKNQSDSHWIKKNYYQVLIISILYNLILCLIVIIFTNRIVTILFGAKYIEISSLIKILMIGYFIFAALKIPNESILSSTGHVKFNLYNSILGIIIAIIANILFVKIYGIIGAGYSFVATTAISCLISYIYINGVVLCKK